MRTVIEVGANLGDDTYNYLTQDDMVLYGFEPTYELIRILNEKFGNDPRVKLIPLAVDIENRFTTFNIAGWQNWGCSSLNEFTDGVSERWNGFNFHYTGKQSVMTIRLDDFCKMYGIEHIDYIHIDAQGSDFNVLKSLGDYIDCVDAGVCEVSYNVPLYKGVDNTYASVTKWLTERGFVYDQTFDHEQYRAEANVYFRRK
jgi:FkbM family methyltransferase